MANISLFQFICFLVCVYVFGASASVEKLLWKLPVYIIVQRSQNHEALQENVSMSGVVCFYIILTKRRPSLFVDKTLSHLF